MVCHQPLYFGSVCITLRYVSNEPKRLKSSEIHSGILLALISNYIFLRLSITRLVQIIALKFKESRQDVDL
jgi:hypothetical protein